MAAPIVSEIRLKARQSENQRFKECARVLDEEGLDTEYIKMLRLIVELEKELDNSAELIIMSREKANEILAHAGSQLTLKWIEPEFQRYFTLEEDGKTMGLSENIDINVALDILENPGLYVPTASSSERMERYNPLNSYAPPAGDSSFPSAHGSVVLA